MIFLIVLILATILCSFLGYREHCDVFFSGLTGAFFGAILGLIIVCFATLMPGEKIYVLDSTQNIVAMTDGSNASGSFYLFGGTVKDKIVYHYAYEGEMGIRIKSLYADDCTIAYTDGQPKIEKYSVCYKNPVHRFLAASYIRYKFLVPKGTVTTEYEVDLK